MEEGLAESVTRVVKDDHVQISVGRSGQEFGTMMAVNTKEFGETARLQDGLTEEHWFNYLNELSQTTNGILISGNLAKKYELNIGDTITYSRFSPLDSTYIYAASAGKIVGIVDAFPGYQTVTYGYNDQGEMTEKENFLIVANYASEVATFEKTPYSVWMRTTHSETEIRENLEAKLADGGRTLKNVVSAETLIREMQASSMIKITNGLFTLDFLVALLLCRPLPDQRRRLAVLAAAALVERHGQAPRRGGRGARAILGAFPALGHASSLPRVVRLRLRALAALPLLLHAAPRRGPDDALPLRPFSVLPLAG